ncbi:hypothetical protein KR215_007968 [Drosophila sulfurigaster]|nr:hypothetical protein KR215_007968 [Drosophila sulfurigaster]
MNLIGLSLFVIIAMQSWQLGVSDCCVLKLARFQIKKGDDCHNYHKSIKIPFTQTCIKTFCRDLSEPSPCCGVGSCNTACCDCRNGCRNGDIGEQLEKLYGKNITVVSPKPRSSDDVDEGLNEFQLNPY